MEYWICFVAVLLMVWASPICAEERLSYTVYRAGTPITVDGRLDEPAWNAAPDVGAFVFPWYESGKKEQTVAKLLWDDEHLYVSYICEDAHISASHTERDSAVYRDDCVEVFFAPNPDRPQSYFNIEMNVLGVFLDQFHPEGPGVPVPREWNGEGIRISTSIVGTLNDDSDTDSYWILEASIPFSNFAEVARHTPPVPGDVWHLNLNRLGGKTNPQYSQWCASRTPKPQFHAPDDFGRVIFSEQASPFWKR
ncbi:MAG: carbohydrate-binding family 9-like protein [bacterium]|nr:carbohydrate-binding family 9-like protein [bacterium]